MKGLEQQKVWDPVTRLWHWVLVVAVCVGWSFGRFMTFDTIQWHFYIGYSILGLIAFRLIWGLVGPAPIRLAALVPGVGATIRYIKNIGSQNPSGTPGHNPLGSLSVIAMLMLLLAQAGSGLFIESDDFFESGPMAGYVPTSVINQLTWWHRFLSDFILAIVVIHVAAILFYLLWKKENLIKPMITGWKWVKRKDDS